MKIKHLAVGLALAGLASCNWYNIPNGQRCCSSGVPTNPQVVRPGTEAQPTTTVPTNTLPEGSNPNQYDYSHGYFCNLEPSQTPEGYEVIAHPVGVTPTVQGVTVPCP